MDYKIGSVPGRISGVAERHPAHVRYMYVYVYS